MTATDIADLPPAFTVPISGNLPVTQGFSPLGRYALEWPVEWVPQAAEGIVQVADPSDKGLLWREVARVFKRDVEGGGGGGGTGTVTTSPAGAGKPNGAGR
ncbi:hypothetical protein HDU67_005882, partial [Dinochytrium kinnereticum]